MIVLALQQNGVMEVVSPSRLFQGTDTETILVLSPFPSTVPLSIAFTRPDGSAANEEAVIENNNTYYTAYHPMLYTPLPSQFEGKGVTAWTYEPNAAWTAQYGNGLISVYAQFPAEVYGDEDNIDNFTHHGRMTSFMAQVTIEETQLPNLPGAPTAVVYSEIIAYLSNYGTQLESLDDRMDTAEENIEELQHTVYGYEEDGEHVDGLADRMNTAERNIDSFESRMGTAESDIDNLETDVSRLQGRMTTAEGTISQHTGDISDLNTAVYNINANFANYYTKSQTYSKQEVNDLVDAIPKFNILVVDQLPTTNISTTTIYLVPASIDETNNVFTEYIYAQNEQHQYQWEILGAQTIDMSQYSTTSQMNAAIAAAEARVKSYADGKDAETLAAAKAYTDEQVGAGEGTIISVGGVVKRNLSFTSDPQTQIDEKAFSRVYRSITDVDITFTTSVTMGELCGAMIDGSYLMADITEYANLLPSGETTGFLTIEKGNGEGKAEFLKYPFSESFSQATEKKLRRTFYYNGYFYALFYDENDVGNENKIVKQDASYASGDHWTNVVIFPVDISSVKSYSFSGSKCCYATNDVFIIFDPTATPAVEPTVITPNVNLTGVLYSQGNLFYFGALNNQFIVYDAADNTFSYIPYPPNGTPSSAIVINEGANEFLYATTSYGFYKYSISNETWTTIETWNNTHISNIKYNSGNEKIYLFGHNDTREAVCRVYNVLSGTFGDMVYAPFSPNPNVINDIQCTDIVDGKIYCSATVDALETGGEHNYHSELAIFYVSAEKFGGVVAGNPLYDDTSLGIVATSAAPNVTGATDNVLLVGTDDYAILSVQDEEVKVIYIGAFRDYVFSGWNIPGYDRALLYKSISEVTSESNPTMEQIINGMEDNSILIADGSDEIGQDIYPRGINYSEVNCGQLFSIKKVNNKHAEIKYSELDMFRAEPSSNFTTISILHVNGIIYSLRINGRLYMYNISNGDHNYVECNLNQTTSMCYDETNNKIYIVGATDSSSTAHIDIFDIETKTFGENSIDMLIPFSPIDFSGQDGNLYSILTSKGTPIATNGTSVAVGGKGASNQATVSIYNLSLGAVSYLSNSSLLPGSRVTAIAYNGSLLLCGSDTGYVSRGSTYSRWHNTSVFTILVDGSNIYTGASDGLSKNEQRISSYPCITIVKYNDKIYSYGTLTRFLYKANFLIYDPASNIVTTIFYNSIYPLPTSSPSYHIFDLCAADDKIYWNASTFLQNDIEVEDISYFITNSKTKIWTGNFAETWYGWTLGSATEEESSGSGGGGTSDDPNALKIPLYVGQPLVDRTYYFNFKAKKANVDAFLANVTLTESTGYEINSGDYSVGYIITDGATGYHGIYVIDLSKIDVGAGAGTGYSIFSMHLDFNQSVPFVIEEIHYVSNDTTPNRAILSAFAPSFSWTQAGWQGVDHYQIPFNGNYSIESISNSIVDQASAFFSGNSEHQIWNIVAALM